MTDVGAIDQFLAVFSRYIDSGFGLVRGDVASLARILVAIDVTLAAIFWAWSPGEEILARLVKKTLYVGFFAFLLSDFPALASIVYDSFAGLGLKASGGGLSPADLLRPGRIAAVGVEAVRPLLAACGELSGFPAIFENLVQVVLLLVSALVVILAFFVLAVQLFVTLVEFKLTTLAGFVLVPFGLFGRTAFLAERVLGAVIAAGVKVLVLAVIVGIGGVLFEGFALEFAGEQPTLDQALGVALGALTLLGLGIFGPGVASGLVSGAPQLGAGAAVGAGLAVGGLAAAGVGAVRGAAGVAGAARGLRMSDPGQGPPAAAAVRSQEGGEAGSARAPADGPPAWARRMQAAQAVTGGIAAAAHALKAGDAGGGSISVPLQQDSP